MFIRPGKKTSNQALHDLSDHDLILKYRETYDGEIIALLFKRYTHLVYGVSLKYLQDPDDAKDAVMEIFEALMTDLLQYDIRNFKSWLHSVTRNHCLMMLRKKRPERMEAGILEKKKDSHVVESLQSVHQDNAFENYTDEDLEIALAVLKEPQRRCIELFYLEGSSYNEVCRQTGLSYKEVKSHIQNGKRNMKIKLEEILAKKQ
jgi:RNA polymerase sigma-70 factor (ECF subfamily)